jgi:hypothetical protein
MMTTATKHGSQRRQIPIAGQDRSDCAWPWVSSQGQVLQEFPETVAPFRRVHHRPAPDGGMVQVLSRMGYGPGTGMIPQWRQEGRIKNA